MTQFYVYIYRDPSRNFQEIYVGKGQGPRAYKHLTRKDKHPFTQRLQLMKREGVEPHIEIINSIDEDHAYFMEECCIQVLGRKDLCKGTLLNLNNGGKGGMSGHIQSAETRQKKSDANKGRPRTLDTRQKISETNKGKPKVMCPHCGKLGAGSPMSRWHFDRCKSRIHPAI